MAQETWIEEFLFRGRPSWDERPAEFSVTIGMAVTDPLGGRSVNTFGPMTPEKAAAAGYDLATLVAGLDAVALAERDAALAKGEQSRAERDAMKATVEEALAARDAAVAACDQAEADVAALQGTVEALRATLATVTGERDAAQVELAALQDATTGSV